MGDDRRRCNHAADAGQRPRWRSLSEYAIVYTEAKVENLDSQSGVLYLVATPIGNMDDITVRALQILRTVDLVVCEEYPVGERLLKRYSIDRPMMDLNEHNEAERVPEVLRYLRDAKSVALISDGGMPLVQDPGEHLVGAAIEAGMPVTCVPGPSSITAGLALSGLPTARFRYVGYVPPKKPLRRQALAQLRDDPDTLVFAEAPYRLTALLEDIEGVIGADRRAAVACELTTPDEAVYRNTVGALLRHFRAHPFKGEFVIVLAGAECVRNGTRRRNRACRRR